jgi:lantibiotic biosynthesis protein
MTVSENTLIDSTSYTLNKLLAQIKKGSKSISHTYTRAIINLTLFELLDDEKFLFQSNQDYQNIISNPCISEYSSWVTTTEIAFLGQLLLKNGFYQDSAKLKDIDTKLFKQALSQIKFHNTDFGDTLNYFSQNPENQLHVFFVEELLAELIKVVKKDELGARIVHSNKVDLTFPFGMIGLLMSLTKVYVYSINDINTKYIIDDGIKYILSYKNEVDFSEKSFDFFPNQVVEDIRKPIYSHHMSLSSGDLSKAFLLHQYAKISENPNTLRLANFAGLNSLLRISDYQHNNTNPYLLDGSAGVALMYHKMYGFSKIEAYKNGKKNWMDKTIAFLENGNQYEFFQEDNVWKGALGINLALSSCVSDKELSWEKIYGLQS